jgi:hypothetical protein
MPVLDDLSTNDRTALVTELACFLHGRSVSEENETKRATTDKAFQAARTAVKKEMEKIKKEKLHRQERMKAIERRVRPLEEDAAAKRREWLAALRDAAARPELAVGARIDCTAAEYRDHALSFIGNPDSREPLDLLAAFGTDACIAENGNIEATPFCFIRGSGHQNFLDTVRGLLVKVTPERLAQILFEPWVYRDPGLSMRWDPAEDKRYALMDVKPADEGAMTVWMANLLAYRALALFPCTPTRRGLGTTAWTTLNLNGDEQMVFTWPVWEFGASLDTVRTLLQMEELIEARPDSACLAARGIPAVFRARRIRFPATGSSYKLNFTPARAV